MVFFGVFFLSIDVFGHFFIRVKVCKVTKAKVHMNCFELCH